jgi:hypothetical protein
MSQSTPNPANPTNLPPPPGVTPPGATPAAPPPPRKRKRIWLIAIAVLLVVVILLVLLAPTIAGMGPVRSIVASQINDHVNGSVEIGDYSIGWTSGITASDVKVYDTQHNLILQLKKFTSGLSLLDLLKGNYALGDTSVDVSLDHAEVGADGQLNYLTLIKQEKKAKPDEPAAKPKESESKPITLPSVSGKLTINYEGTVYQNGSALVQIQPSTAVIDIPSINQSITDDVALNYSVNGGSTGVIHIAGSASAVTNNQLDATGASADEKVDLSNVDLKALSALLPIASPSLKLQTSGIASGSLALKADGGDSIAASGQIDVAKFTASGQPLKGADHLAIDQITIPIDISRTDKDGGPFIDVKHADVLLNGGQLGKITIAASAPQDALVSAAALVPAVIQRVLLGTEPSSESLWVDGEGTATITANLDVAALASQLPSTIGLQQGMQLTQGHLSHQTTISISKDTAKIDSDTKLPDLKGTRDGKPVELTPIDMGAGLSAVGGASPDLRDLSVHLTSGFLNASGGGATLSQEKLTGSFDLANLQAQAAQFVDLDALLSTPAKSTTAPAAATQPNPAHVQLAGSGTFELTTDGDLINPDGQAKVATSLTLTGIDASGIGTLAPVKLANLTATLGGDLHRSAAALDYKNFTASLAGGGITISSKDAAAPPILDNETINADLNGDILLPIGDGRQSINLTSLEVKSSSDLFGLLADPNTPGGIKISREKGVIKASGVLAVNADLKKLDDLAQRFAASPAPTAPAPTTGVVASGQLQSGLLNGTLNFSRGDQPQTDIAFAGAITDLTVTTAQQPITNETVKLTAHAISPDDHSALKADASLDSHFATVSLANASLEIAQAASVWDVLQQADVTLNIPDLPAVYSILNAFSPPAAQAAGTWPNSNWPGANFGGARIIATGLDSPDTETPEQAAKRRKRERAARAAAKARAAAEAPLPPLAPLLVTGGSMGGKITILRDAPSQTTTINVTDLAISRLALARGDTQYALPHDVDFKLAFAVKASADSGKSSPIDQIQQIQFTQLSGDLPGAQLTMPLPIVISSPGDPNQIDAHGTINVTGALADATPLLQVLQGAPQPMPYAGTYSLTQALGTGTAATGKLLRLVGGIDVTNLQMLDGTGKAVYTEPTVTIKNDLDYIVGSALPTTMPTDRARSTDQAIVRSLTVDMPSSQALAINFSGRVADPFNKRVIRGLGSEPAARLDLTYDLAKLWPIIEPTLAPDLQAKYKDLKVIGKEHRTFTISGYFPMARTMPESIRHLNADGGLALDELDLPQGLTITTEDLPFKMTNGVIQTAASAHPQTIGADTTQPIIANTAICNQGAIDLSNLAIDLGQPSPLLTIPKGHKLLQSVHVNPVLAGTLGSGNLLFNDVSQANGLLDVTVIQCDGVPLGDLITHAASASATIVYSISDLSIDGPIPQLLSSKLSLGGKGLHGGIQDGKLTLASGEVDNDFTFNIIRYVQPTPVAGQTVAGQPTDRQSADTGTTSATPTDSSGTQLVPENVPLKFTGGVLLASSALKNFEINVPQGLLPSKWASALPNGVVVPLTGTTNHPTLDIQKALVENAGAGLLNGGANGNGGVGGLLNGLLNKKKKQPQPASPDSGGQ